MNITALFDLVPYNQSRRMNCPECGGLNTLSVTKEDGIVKYNCYKAKCGLSGSRIVRATHGELLNVWALRNRANALTAARKVFVLPDYWVQGLASKKCFQMLLNHNALEAYTLGLIKVAYDPKLDRLVYLIQNENGAVVGGVGRSLRDNVVPKAYNYPDSAPMPFKCGTGDTAVLVEDCASACSIGRFKEYTGIALLGTVLRDDYLLHIVNKYTKVILALDNDATYKSVKIRNELENYIDNITIWRLTKDFKSMTHKEVQEFIDNPVKQIYIDM